MIQALTATFRSRSLDESDLDLSQEEKQELFDLAYTLLIQRRVAGYVPLYNSLYALYRGMLAGARWATALSVIFLMVYLMEIFCYGRSDLTIESALFAASLFGFAFLGWGKPLKNQFDHYAKRFAVSVYRNFWAWHTTLGGSRV